MGKPRRPLWNENLVPVTLEQLQLANKLAHAASHGEMRRKSFKVAFEEGEASGAIAPGSYYVLTDDPMNHAAMAIMEAFNPTRSEEDVELAKSLLHRTIFASHDVYTDERAKRYLKRENGEDFIGHPLLEAFATMPLKLREPTPLDAIFKRADEIAAAEGWNEASQ